MPPSTHLAPHQRCNAVLNQRVFYYFYERAAAARRNARRDAGHEKDADRNVAVVVDIDAFLLQLLAEKKVGDLRQYPDTVACEAVRAHGAAMIQVLERLRRLRHSRVRLDALDVNNKTDTCTRSAACAKGG